MADEYKIRPFQLRVLRDILARNDNDVTKSVEIFVKSYVHDKKDEKFWAKWARKIKADPKFLDNWLKEHGIHGRKPRSMLDQRRGMNKDSGNAERN